jgi:hypothetical protein
MSARSICPACIEQLKPLDPLHRCVHCFVELEQSNMLCQRCAIGPLLSAKRASLFEQTMQASKLVSILQHEQNPYLLDFTASLFILQWDALKWPLPDRIVILPTKTNEAWLETLLESLSKMCGALVCKALRLEWVAPFEWRCTSGVSNDLQNQVVLLLTKEASLQALREAVSALAQSLPKQVLIHSVFDS